MLRLDITPLEPGLHEFTLTPTAEDLGLDPDAFTEITVEVRLDHGRDRTMVFLAARASATLECDRTLELFQQRVSGRHAVLFVAPEDLEQHGEDAENDDELRPLPEPGFPLDLTAPVRDTLLLALPARRVAPGAEDRDIPLTFGAVSDDAGEKIDPRWEALRRLRDDS